jgi:hypothetical protein
MERLELSYEIYPDAHSFSDSVLVSVSDYIVCCSEYINEVCDIVKVKFKSAKIIHLTDHTGKSSLSKGAYNIIKTTSDFAEIAKYIRKDSTKIGCRIVPMKKLFVFKREIQFRSEDQ